MIYSPGRVINMSKHQRQGETHGLGTVQQRLVSWK